MEFRTIRAAADAAGASFTLSEGTWLDAEEVRVLGCLVEKEAATPDYYPMTLNALVNACNQKSSRNPVVSYTDQDVLGALQRLQDKGISRRITGSASRVPKYRHIFSEAFALTEPQRTALCILMLRGPQTVGEVRQRSGRIYEYSSLNEVQEALEDLAGRETQRLVLQLVRRPGEKEPRYAHLISGPVSSDALSEPQPAAPRRSSAVDGLKGEVSDLREQVEALRAEFETFREQFTS